VLGLINGKAVLIGPTDCIGHGACKTACPFDCHHTGIRHRAARPGYSVLKPNFESNVPGIYVAGELGGMGLIKECPHAGSAGTRGNRRGGRESAPARSMY